jgi:galactose-1-phosphate uridylyltransferase
VGDIRQTEILTAFVPEPSTSEFEVAIAKLERYKSPGADQISAELIQAVGETLHSVIHKLIKLIWSKEELFHQ